MQEGQDRFDNSQGTYRIDRDLPPHLGVVDFAEFIEAEHTGNMNGDVNSGIPLPKCRYHRLYFGIGGYVDTRNDRYTCPGVGLALFQANGSDLIAAFGK